MMTSPVRVAPNSKESEMMVLGCMLTNINALNSAADLLEETDFYYTEHKIVFAALKDAYANDKPADIHLICEELKRRKKLKNVGGAAYITSLAQYAGTSAHIDEYCSIVKNKATLRRIIQAAQTVEQGALEDPADVTSFLDEAQQHFFRIGQAADRDKGILLRDILGGTEAESGLPFLKELQDRQEAYQTRGDEAPPITGIPTHFIDLDRMINGLNGSHLILVAARPAMGKTVLATNIAENVCFKQGLPVGIFSLEMTAEQLVQRIICSQAEVPNEKIKNGSLNGAEFQRIVETVNRLQNHTMVIDDQSGLKITDLRARARRMKEAYDIQLLVVDYLQLISGSGSNRTQESRQLEISEISRLMKNLARELNIPIICISQLSRKVEERQGHRPMMSDLRESGTLEQDSDTVLLLLRREYYDPMDKPGMAELIIGKNRHGSVGTVNLTFRGEFTQFANYAPPA